MKCLKAGGKTSVLNLNFGKQKNFVPAPERK